MGSVGTLVRNPYDVPEGDDDPKEQHHQQTPGRRACETVDYPTDQAATDKPPKQFRQHSGTQAIIRIGPLHLRPVPGGTRLPSLGAMLWLVPGHCDPTVNLHNTMVGVRGGLLSGVVESIIKVDARGAIT